ncbi:MAG TPA: hypothetical protein VE693_10080 [Gaiellaceae bacterium]|nr:hypothetical protein [Gaiellaceae bacterium]
MCDPGHTRNYGRRASPRLPGSLKSPPIGSPAPKRPLAEDPPIDPGAVERRFARARARRRARIEHKRELRRARLRFLVLFGILVFVTLFLALSIWQKIQDAFGI